MSETFNDLVQQSYDLIESIKQLRKALLDYQKGCERLLKTGELDRSTVERVELLQFAERRERLAGALAEFEAARRRALIGLIDVAGEEGSNLSEVARTLGVSRQLLSRLSIESRRDDSH